MTSTIYSVLAGLGLLLLAVWGCNAAKKAERAFGEALFQHWIHAFEDDSPDARAFRPSEYAFPPARGREGLAIRKDGTYTHYRIAPTDGNVAEEGRWAMKGRDAIRFTPADGKGEAFEWKGVTIKDDVLRVQK